MSTRRAVMSLVALQAAVTAAWLFVDYRSLIASRGGYRFWVATGLGLTVLVAQFVVASMGFLPIFGSPPSDAPWTNSDAYRGYLFATILFLPVFAVVGALGAVGGRWVRWYERASRQAA